MCYKVSKSVCVSVIWRPERFGCGWIAFKIQPSWTCCENTTKKKEKTVPTAEEHRDPSKSQRLWKGRFEIFQVFSISASFEFLFSDILRSNIVVHTTVFRIAYQPFARISFHMKWNSVDAMSMSHLLLLFFSLHFTYLVADSCSVVSV